MRTPAQSSSGQNTHRRSRRSGVALITAAVSTVLLVPLLGLAIDVGFLYAVRAKLAAAADASVLAAIEKADDPAAAEARARAFFRANFPDGFLNTSRPRIAVTLASGQARPARVTLEVAVEAPTFFFAALGVHQTTIRATAEAEAASPFPLLIVQDRAPVPARSTSWRTRGTMSPDPAPSSAA